MPSKKDTQLIKDYKNCYPNQIKSNKTANKMLAEILKALRDDLAKYLRFLFQKICVEGDVPQDFTNGVIANLYKNEDRASNCNNYRDNTNQGHNKPSRIYVRTPSI